MRPKQFRVELTEEERLRLLLLTRQGKAPARTLQRAHILLRASEGAFDWQTAEALHVSAKTVMRVRRRFAEASAEASAEAAGEERLDVALYDRPRPGSEPKLDARAEAFLVALACSDAPEGREHWTMQLLADRLVELEIIDSISDGTVRRTLKKTSSSPGRRPSGASRR